jgi:hypothetical protein
MGSDGNAMAMGTLRGDSVAIQTEPNAAADGGRDVGYWEFNRSLHGCRC